VDVLPNFGSEPRSDRHPDENWKISKRKYLLAEFQGKAPILVPEREHLSRCQAFDCEMPF
jgi:hypothetical protein